MLCARAKTKQNKKQKQKQKQQKQNKKKFTGVNGAGDAQRATQAVKLRTWGSHGRGGWRGRPPQERRARGRRRAQTHR